MVYIILMKCPTCVFIQHYKFVYSVEFKWDLKSNIAHVTNISVLI